MKEVILEKNTLAIIRSMANVFRLLFKFYMTVSGAFIIVYLICKYIGILYPACPLI